MTFWENLTKNRVPNIHQNQRTPSRVGDTMDIFPPIYPNHPFFLYRGIFHSLNMWFLQILSYRDISNWEKYLFCEGVLFLFFLNEIIPFYFIYFIKPILVSWDYNIIRHLQTIKQTDFMKHPFSSRIPNVCVWKTPLFQSLEWTNFTDKVDKFYETPLFPKSYQ